MKDVILTLDQEIEKRRTELAALEQARSIIALPEAPTPTPFVPKARESAPRMKKTSRMCKTWSDEEIAILTNMWEAKRKGRTILAVDKSIAKHLGRSVSGVQTMRVHLGLRSRLRGEKSNLEKVE